MITPSHVIKEAVHLRERFLTQDQRIFLPLALSLLNRKVPTSITGFPLSDFPKRGSETKTMWNHIMLYILWIIKLLLFT